MNERISDLPDAATPLAGTEVIEVSVPDGLGGFNSKKITTGDLNPAPSLVLDGNTLTLPYAYTNTTARPQLLTVQVLYSFTANISDANGSILATWTNPGTGALTTQFLFIDEGNNNTTIQVFTIPVLPGQTVTFTDASDSPVSANFQQIFILTL